MTGRDGGGEPRQGGFECPACGARIRVELQGLLDTLRVACSGCGLELSVDQDRSRRALEEIRRLQAGLERADGIARRSCVEEPDRHPRRRPLRRGRR